MMVMMVVVVVMVMVMMMMTVMTMMMTNAMVVLAKNHAFNKQQDTNHNDQSNGGHDLFSVWVGHGGISDIVLFSIHDKGKEGR